MKKHLICQVVWVCARSHTHISFNIDICNAFGYNRTCYNRRLMVQCDISTGTNTCSQREPQIVGKTALNINRVEYEHWIVIFIFKFKCKRIVLTFMIFLVVVVVAPRFYFIFRNSYLPFFFLYRTDCIQNMPNAKTLQWYANEHSKREKKPTQTQKGNRAQLV